MALCKAMVNAASDTDPQIRILRQCRCKARNGEDTCGTHRSFFNKARWMVNVLCGAQFSSVLLGAKDESSVYHVNHIRQTLASSRVELTYADVKAIENNAENIDVYRLLCESTKINPMWNPRLCVRTIVHYVWLITQGIPAKNYLDSILNNPNLEDIYILRIFLSYWGKVTHLRPVIDLVIQDILKTYPKLYDISLYHEKYLLRFCNNPDFYLTRNPVSLDEINEYTQKTILPIVRENRKIARQVHKDRIDAMKEELMAKMWSPERIEKYNETYGIFLLDDCDPWLMAEARGPRD